MFWENSIKGIKSNNNSIYLGKVKSLRLGLELSYEIFKTLSNTKKDILISLYSL